MGLRMDARLSISVVAAVFLAASAFPGISAGLEGYSPGYLALLRFLMASLVLAVYAVFSGIRLSCGEGPSGGGPGRFSGLQRLQRALGLRADERSGGDGEPFDRLDPGLHRAVGGGVPR